MNEQLSLIPEELMLARIAQSEQMREFFIQMWRENPQMAAQAGGRIHALMSPLAVPTAGHFIPPAGRPSGGKRPAEAAPTFGAVTEKSA